jgi:hypothetical protein
MNKIVSRILLNFKPKQIDLILGRWKVENCHKKIDRKIDFANEDHCGPCGNNSLTTNSSTTNSSTTNSSTTNSSTTNSSTTNSSKKDLQLYDIKIKK